MKGSVYFLKDRGQWVVSFYIPGRKNPVKVTRYKGEFMYSENIARKCLNMIQGDYERWLEGLCEFRIEKYTGKGWTDVIEYFEEWLEVKKKKKPATLKGYKSYLKNWIRPFFAQYPVMLHEIQLATLHKMLEFITLSGKGKHNVMMCFHTFMDYAWRNRRIPEVPPFPPKEDYGIVEPTIKWLPEHRQMAIINAIPENDRPIFLWLKYHLRRLSEACALKWEDYDQINQIFIIKRGISARRLVESTKTGHEHIIPCHDQFIHVLESIPRSVGGYVFINKRGRNHGKRYGNYTLNRIWKEACRKTNENIDLYSGLKHSSCSQYVNEKGLSISDLQVITDHKRLESVKRYAKVNVARKRELMSRKVISITSTKQVQGENLGNKS